jgi:glycosyltransferase involved in cell wall biosynthesis
LIVHTLTQQAQIKKWYGVDAQVTTCCPTKFFSNDELTTSAKRAARERLGIAATDFLVSSFGIMTREKGTETCILAVEILRHWNIPAQLYFVGSGAAPEKAVIDRLSSLYSIKAHVHYGVGSGFIDEERYRDFLIASDAALQLRTYGFGQLSAALADCISAGLPCVASYDLAKSCDAPEYVSTVPDLLSPLLVAEQLALIWEARTETDSHADARAAYLETHNFHYYAKRLTEILGVA